VLESPFFSGRTSNRCPRSCARNCWRPHRRLHLLWALFSCDTGYLRRGYSQRSTRLPDMVRVPRPRHAGVFPVLGVVYFVLGYLLLAVAALAIAAICSTVREAQGIAPLFTLMAIAPFWFISLLMFFPNSPVWVVLSLLPFTAPVLVMLRLGITGVPTWQLVASMAILIASARSCGH